MRVKLKTVGHAASVGLLLGAPLLAIAQAGFIFTCTDAGGKRLSSDRPMIECSGREQRVLNSDGSLNRVLPPPLTADERAAADARERKLADERVARLESARRDRNLLARFPTEAAHDAARNAAFDDVRSAMRNSQARLAALAAERKPLLVEAEFYAGKTLPLKLRSQLDAIDAAVDAQRVLSVNQQAEVQRLHSVYEGDLARLKRLWAGAEPGSIGAIASASVDYSASAARKR